MKRLVLRNPTKIKEKIGIEELKAMLKSIDAYESSIKELDIVKISDKPHFDFIDVPNVYNPEHVFTFALVEGGLYGVQILAYYRTSFVEKKQALKLKNVL